MKRGSKNVAAPRATLCIVGQFGGTALTVFHSIPLQADGSANGLFIISKTEVTSPCQAAEYTITPVKAVSAASRQPIAANTPSFGATE